MKRIFILVSLLVLLSGRRAPAQDTTPVPSAAPNTAATVAAREEAEERYKRMAADLQSLQADNEALHAKIASLETALQSLRDAQSKPVDNSAVQDGLKKLAEKIEEVDKKRMEDKDTISEEIHKAIGGIDATLRNAPPPSREPRSKTTPVNDTPIPANGYSYTIADGDRLDLIVKAYNKDYRSKGLKPITMKQAMEANPNVNWNRLKAGQKIIIPRPEGG